MAGVLILSSFVAASRVGGGAQALALARLGIEPILAPTVLFGRHPGLGPPGGGVVSAEMFAGMLAAAEAQGVFAKLDAVITGYFATAEQVAIAADAMARVKAGPSAVRIVVDPIMGDDPTGLYVDDAVAVAIAERLVPVSDLVCPNAWELGRLTGAPVTDAASAVLAARRLGRPTLVSSISSGDEIGVVYANRGAAWLASHQRAPAAPKGVGDLLTAYVTAALVHRRAAPQDALSLGVGAVADVVGGSGGADPLVATLPFRLAPSRRVRVEALGG